jgi:hypothetical protein
VNESGSSVLAANLEMTVGFTTRLGSRRQHRHNAPGSGLLDRPRATWDRCWADRQPGVPAVGIPKRRGFPQVRAGCAACGCFWLNDSEEVRLDKHAMDVEFDHEDDRR